MFPELALRSSPTAGTASLCVAPMASASPPVGEIASAEHGGQEEYKVSSSLEEGYVRSGVRARTDTARGYRRREVLDVVASVRLGESQIGNNPQSFWSSNLVFPQLRGFT